MHEQFRIVFRGQINSGAELAAVKVNLQKLTGFSAGQIEQLFSGPETVLKKGLDRTTADRYLAAIQATGALCSVEPMDSPQAVSQPSHASQSPHQPSSNETTCPKCGVRQPAGDSCLACGIVYAKYDPERIVAAPSAATLPPTVQESGTGAAGLWVVALLVVVIAATLWWLNFPRSNALPEGAVINEQHHFAYAAPPGWLTITPQNYDKVMAEVQGHFPAELRGIISNRHPGFVASHLKTPDGTSEFSPNFNIIVVDTKGKDFPVLNESEKEKATSAITEEIARRIRGYRVVESSIIDVDGIKSLQITGEAELSIITKPAQPIQTVSKFGWKTFHGYTPEERKTFQMKVIQTVIPGKKRGYVVSSTFEAGDGSQGGEINRTALESFRVLERPPRFGSIMMGALNGGLLAAGGCLLWFLFGRVVLKQD